jgi:hypothetical protein
MTAKRIVLTTPPANIERPNANFVKNDFEILIWNKGYDVVLEKSVKCPCKSKGGGHQSNCRNCGGTGWAFINPIQTRMILHSMNISTEYKEWSEENMGTVSISCMDREELSFMDRITVLNGNAIFSEVLYLRDYDTNLFYFSTYNIKKILYIALFEGENQPYRRLEEDEYTFENNIITLSDSFEYDEQMSLTIRYVHAPQYYVLDMGREVMNSFVQIRGEESNVSLPVSAVGRRSHYILDAEKFGGGRIIDNSFLADQCNVKLKK